MNNAIVYIMQLIRRDNNYDPYNKHSSCYHTIQYCKQGYSIANYILFHASRLSSITVNVVIRLPPITVKYISPLIYLALNLFGALSVLIPIITRSFLSVCFSLLLSKTNALTKGFCSVFHMPFGSISCRKSSITPFAF